MPKFDPSKAGKRGGKARAAKLTPEERTQIARNAAITRWEQQPDGQNLPRAICGGDDHCLEFGEIRIPCYVLDDERRVISMRGMSTCIGLSTSGGAPRMAQYVASIDPNLAKANELAARLKAPILFRPRVGGKIAHGYEATLLADICDAILEARANGHLITDAQKAIGARAETLVRGWARVGILAVVDEATGFQYVRSRTALAEILAKFISDKMMPWTKRFPDEFYVEMFRLKGWDYMNLKPGDAKPSIVGWYTRNIVYQRLAPGVIQELERLNPPVEAGRRRHKHHQWLTEEIGHSGLREHLAKVVTTMQLSTDWENFRSNLRRVLPKRWEQFQFDDLFPTPAGNDVPTDDDLD